MPKTKKSPTTGGESTRPDNGVAISEDASGASFARLMADDSGSQGGDVSSRQDDESDEIEEEDEPGDLDESTEGDADDSSEEEDEDDTEEEDDADEGEEDEEADETDPGESGLDDLTREEAVALAKRQRKGVEKLKARNEKLAEDLDAATATAAKHADSAKIVAKFDELTEDMATAPGVLAKMLTSVAKKHGIKIAELAGSVTKIAEKDAGEGEPDFEAQARAIADTLDFEYEDEKERAIKMQAAMARALWERDQASRPKPQEGQAQQSGKSQTDIQAKFDKQFGETVTSFKEDYPEFKLTKSMALKAVDKYKHLSVEDACWRMYRAELNESLVRKVRKDSKQKAPTMVRSHGKQGKPKSLPKDQAKWTSEDLRKAMQ